MKLRKVIILLALVVCGFVKAEAFSMDDIHFWVGEGTNRCGVAVDWYGEAKAWGYRWNGTCTNLLEVVRRIVREDHRLTFSYQQMTESYVDLYFFGYDVNDVGCQWNSEAGESSDGNALAGIEDRQYYSQWWVLYGPMNGAAFPTAGQISASEAANEQIPVNNDWFVFSLGYPDYDENWNESPAVLTTPVAAESPYGFEVVDSSSEATGNFKEPKNVLGRPTTYMKGTWGGPVSPYNPAWMANELLTLKGDESYVTIKFDHDVMDDANNPWGIDLIVYGNAFGVGTSTEYYTQTTDPSTVSFTGGGAPEPAKVEVSQDGETWFSYTEERPADDFAPTLGLVYDEADPDITLYSGNKWWGLPTDACYPVDPSLSWSSLKGLTLKQVAQYYNGSAGGTGYDLAKFRDEDGNQLPATRNGRRWIRYVKVSNIEVESSEGDKGYNEPEVDAVADVAPISAYDQWKLANYDWTKAWDESVAGKSAVAANGKSNGLCYLLGLTATEAAADASFTVASFTPGELFHELTLVSKAEIKQASGIVVKQAETLDGAWVPEIPKVVSSVRGQDGGYVTTLRVANQGKFAKLAFE